MKRWLSILVVFLLVASVAGGCRLFRRPGPADPDPTPPDDQQPVQIPEEISQGEGQEPQLRVYMHERGEIVTMDFEEYLMGVVAAEMNPEWPVEALAAQAIIARTFTLQKIAEQGTLPNRDAHASTDIQEFQAYNADEINDNVRDAVERTRGEVAVFQGEFARGWFHAYCGGITSTPTQGLNFQGEDPPYLEPVENPCFDFVDEDQRLWSESFTKAQIRNTVRNITNEDPGDFNSIEVAEEAPGGRAVTLRVGDVEVNAPELRLALGSTVMRSTWFDNIEIQGNQVNLSGRGYGHGVGLCQWGANAWAAEGLSPEEIVESFFPGTHIQTIWD